MCLGCPIRAASHPDNGRNALRQGAWAGYVAFAWVVVFFAFHIYWYLGGQFGFGDQTDPLPDWSWSAPALVSSFVTTLAFPLGGLAALAAVQPWGRGIPRSPLLAVLWLGCFVLLLRGGASMVDEVARVTGVLPDGLFGLSYEDVLNNGEPSGYTLWSARAIDAYFILGGLLFGAVAAYFRRKSRLSISPKGHRPHPR
ncbi:MAG: DUF3995 domain-containing protein [Dehalococcoidia bacterium]|nr:DUF3995 domain-containing protein [Dehalococcoidia bacterium]